MAGEHRQILLGDGHIVLINNAVHLSQITCGLGFIHIGDGDQADFEPLAGLLQLTLKSAFLSLGGSQVVLSPQYAKVGLHHPDDQVLLRRRQIGLGSLCLLLASAPTKPGGQVKQCLRQADVIAVGFGLGD